MEVHSATKKKGLMSFAGKLKELEITIEREINQTQKDKYQVPSQLLSLDFMWMHKITSIFFKSPSTRHTQCLVSSSGLYPLSHKIAALRQMQ